jgi:hypothetical protein
MAELHGAVTEAEVLVLARQYLQPFQPSDYRLEIPKEGIRHEDDWWYVLVKPDRDDVRAYDYYDRLAQAETALQDFEHINVLLVPVLPG